jgi:hypothetical protein
MNTNYSQTAAQALRVFQADKIVTVEQLASLLGSPVVTARRYLRRWNAFTSYNLKGMYYTLPDIPVFDDQGLWMYQQARFTRHGNLRHTIVHLVRQSTAGLTAGEIGRIVGLNPSSFMHHFHDVAGLRREQLGGRYLYFSDHPESGGAQETTRREGPPPPGETLTDAEAIAVLVQFIKHAAADEIQLCAWAGQVGRPLTTGQVRDFLSRHGLLKKKLRLPRRLLP